LLDLLGDALPDLLSQGEAVLDAGLSQIGRECP
jgi:hypothetical protein